MSKLDEELEEIITEKELQYNAVIHFYNSIGCCPYTLKKCENGAYCQECGIYLEGRK